MISDRYFLKWPSHKKMIHPMGLISYTGILLFSGLALSIIGNRKLQSLEYEPINLGSHGCRFGGHRGAANGMFLPANFS
jgi:hypothetical protein